MKKKQIFVLLIVIAFINVGIVSLALTVTAKTNKGVRPLEELAMMDLTHENFIDRDSKARKMDAQSESIITSGGSPATQGDEIIVSVSDDYLGESYDETFVVVADGASGIILVEKAAFDALYDGYYHFSNPNGDDSEPWLRSEDLISPVQLQYLLDEFDNNIYEAVTSVFGDLNPRGTEGQKVWVLIHNIRDDAYYLPEATSYIAGYFSSSENTINDKNMFHIDSYDWQNRVGPDGARPHLYEGTFAHEFEHMVHFDVDPDEPSWVDEGLADLAGYLSGYGHSSGHIANYLVYHDTTSLTFWGGGLEDYGASYLFQLYLYEKYGGATFVSALVDDQANGIEGIQNNLPTGVTFDEVYDAWTIAVYHDDLALGSLYGFDTLDIGTEDTWRYSIRYVLDNMIFGGPTVPPGGYLGSAKPYTAQYYRFGTKKDEIPVLIYVEGETTSGPGPYGGSGFSWSSGVGAWSWRGISQTFDLTSYTEVTLDFYTYFEIEYDWDYGYVEVYVHGVDEWYTLNDPSVVMYDDDGNLVPMVDYNAYDQDNPNTPDGREPTAYEDAGRWHAFTGDSGGWIPVSMDLTPFAGHIIDLYFTTWQDGAFTLQMMYVDNINITADGIYELEYDNVPDEVLTDWDATPNFEGGGSWSISLAFAENNWQATYIETFKEPTKRNRKGDHPSEERELFSMQHIAMFEDISWFPYYGPTVQMGQLVVISSPAVNRESMVLILSNRKDHILPGGFIAYFG